MKLVQFPPRQLLPFPTRAEHPPSAVVVDAVVSAVITPPIGAGASANRVRMFAAEGTE